MSGDRVVGPFGIDPLRFTFVCFSLLIAFVFYLLLPRGIRVHYFGAYPKRYAWSARSRTRRSQSHVGGGGSTIGGSSIATGTTATGATGYRQLQGIGLGAAGAGAAGGPNAASYASSSILGGGTNSRGSGANNNPDLEQNDEIVISAAMQQLRDPGVLIIAHGSRGKPKTVRLQLTESAITWRTETRKKGQPKDSKPKMGKLHQVPLSHIMYVDVGKQTTALRRVENASVSETLCFSLLTKEGSLDLEANSPRERDALVSCFSLVLDEVHAQNWRDIYRGPSSDMPSSFDDFDQQQGGGQQGGQTQQQMQQGGIDGNGGAQSGLRNI
eukprot:CAMPEP_0195286164 /NCGR_PEP_ID=MMETSP0707-20130614/3722_1 /TAXON_ID=33640 /ORGANISM="Asterionellopsis glacialis, Strain CCMP134" /LENGTH=326 /DNA_ID=CAMNT_0040345763 /DNA_START=190 /DNA_END=1170 /DNA_ORIENTATION=+